jgi:hypothetical protein
MILSIIISILYVSGGVYWLNKLGDDGVISTPIQVFVILFLWPVTWYFYNR